jgi:putative PIN family toxin of toxin-antitoxin system
LTLIVLDTNVLVSGLLTPFGAAARVVDTVLSGTVRLALDGRILQEYAEVLSRPRFGFRRADVDRLLDFLRGAGVSVVAPPLALSLPDPEDAMFVEVAVASGAEAIVTGNTRNFPRSAALGIPVPSPAEFLARR